MKLNESTYAIPSDLWLHHVPTVIDPILPFLCYYPDKVTARCNCGVGDAGNPPSDPSDPRVLHPVLFFLFPHHVVAESSEGQGGGKVQGSLGADGAQIRLDAGGHEGRIGRGREQLGVEGTRIERQQGDGSRQEVAPGHHGIIASRGIGCHRGTHRGHDEDGKIEGRRGVPNDGTGIEPTDTAIRYHGIDAQGIASQTKCRKIIARNARGNAGHPADGGDQVHVIGTETQSG